MTALETNGRISRTDLEVAFSRVWGDGKEAAGTVVPQALMVAAALGLGVIALAFLAGKRRGRKRAPVVEIRRL